MTRTLLATLFILLAGGIFFFYTRPAYDTVQTQQRQIAQYDQALDKAAQLQQLKQTLLARYNAFDPVNIDRLQKLLPDHVDNIRLILDLNNLAAQHGMALENVDVTDAGVAAVNGNATVIGAQQNYDSLTLRFTTHSTYANFERFLKDLEASLRIVDLVALNITRDAGGSASGGSPLYQYQITIKTYWLK